MTTFPVSVTEPFHDAGCYHIETGPLICSANQWTGFYMITSSVLKGSTKYVEIQVHMQMLFKTIKIGNMTHLHYDNLSYANLH